MNSALATLLVLCPLVTACASVKPAKIVDPAFVQEIHSAHVVKPPDSKRGLELKLANALAAHGIRTTCGPEAEKPADVDAYVTFEGHWSWDMTMYLESLDVSVFRNDNGQLVASAAFKNTFFHSSPDPDEKADEIITAIFGEKTPKPWP